jgi:two-component system, OmpR family, KDP operon response regulator KdpE
VSGQDPLVLVVEDEPQMRRFLRAALATRPFRLIEAATASEATILATSHNPELVLLDLGLPDGDGIELTRRLRTWTHVPIIVISARGREADKVDALDAGADDYLTKPFGIDELLARMRVALRHAREAGGGPLQPVVTAGPLTIDLERREVRRDGKPVRLTPTEFRLLAFLARHAGKVVTHGQILREVWGGGGAAEPHHVRVHMSDLRKKIEDDPARPKIVLTELGVGYRLREGGS